jgi:putative membrane protein
VLLELTLILCAIALGCAAGIITGLTPGVHINLVSAVLLTMSPALLAAGIPLLLVGVLIVAMSVTHTFLDTIPSIFLGAPDDDKALGVLPGHRYLLRGNGMMALKLCIVGGILGSLLAVALFLPSMWLLSWSYELAKPVLFWVMLAVVIFMLYKDQKPILALLVFLWSGLLGVVTLRLPLDEPLLPLLSGLFGIATLLYSINENQQIPDQKKSDVTELDYPKVVSGSLRGTVAGYLTALLPGVSASSAAAASSQGSKMGDHGFLVLLGALGSASFILSLAAYLAIEKARNGAMAVVVTLSEMTPSLAFVLLCVALCATGIAALLTLSLGARACWLLPRIPYRATCIGVIAFVAVLVLWRAGPLGVLVLVASTAVGLMPATLKTARAAAMGCLLLPLLVVLW